VKQITTLGFAIAMGLIAFTTTESHADKKLPYQTQGQLEKKCKAAGGAFESSNLDHVCSSKGNTVYCGKRAKKCITWDASDNSKTTHKIPPELSGQSKGKKRPRVLQENNTGGSEPGDVNPTVLGGSPRATPSGNIPNITNDGNLQ
jgi:hypothetical protein